MVRKAPAAIDRRLQFRYRRIPYRGAIRTGRTLTGSRRVQWILVLAAVLVFGLNLMFGDGGVVDGARLERQLDQTAAQNASYRRELARLEQEQPGGRSDPERLERIGRERYGLSGKDELIFRYDDDGVVAEAPVDHTLDSLRTAAGR